MYPRKLPKADDVQFDVFEELEKAVASQLIELAKMKEGAELSSSGAKEVFNHMMQSPAYKAYFYGEWNRPRTDTKSSSELKDKLRGSIITP